MYFYLFVRKAGESRTMLEAAPGKTVFQEYKIEKESKFGKTEASGEIYWDSPSLRQ
jgi:hypothetical protein